MGQKIYVWAHLHSLERNTAYFKIDRFPQIEKLQVRGTYLKIVVVKQAIFSRLTRVCPLLAGQMNEFRCSQGLIKRI